MTLQLGTVYTPGDVFRPGAQPLPGFRLLHRIGRGGYGEVWKAEAPGGFHVALKLVRLSEGRGGFFELRALEVAKAIRHPNLLVTFGAWVVDDTLIIGMELADRTLWDRYREAADSGLRAIPREELLGYLDEAARGIDHLNGHQHTLENREGIGVQHRDLKPHNILLIGGGVKVADFGMARLIDGSVTGHTGSWTFAYAAPEFFHRRTARQSDQYSLAVTYCHLRAGRLPFQGSAAEVMAGHLMGEPDLSMLPEAERPVVARALAKDPKERWPDCRSFVAALRAVEPGEEPIPVAAEDPHPALADDLSTTGATALVVDRPPEVSEFLSEPPVLESLPPREEPNEAQSFFELEDGPGKPELFPAEPDVRDLAPWRAKVWSAVALAWVAGVLLWTSGVFSLRSAERPRGGPEPEVLPATQVALGGEFIETHEARRPPLDEDEVILAADRREEGPSMPAAVAAEVERAEPPATRPAEAPVEGGSPELVAPVEPDHPSVSSGEDLSDPTSEPPGDLRPQASQVDPEAVAARRDETPDPSAAASKAAEEPAPVRPPALHLGLPEALDITPGEKTSLPIRIARDETPGPVAITIEGLPEGVTASPPTLAADADRGEAVLTAASSAPEGQGALRIVASAGGARAEAEVGYVVHPSPALAHARRGNAALNARDYDRAIAEYNEAIRLDPTDAAIFNNRGLAYRGRGQYHLAIANYNEALRLRPNDARLYYNRGMAYFCLNDTIGAIDDFTRAIDLRPDYAEAYRSRGDAHARRGETDAAKADHAEADRLQASPKHGGATRVGSHSGSRAG